VQPHEDPASTPGPRDQHADQAGLGSARSGSAVTDAASLRARWPDVLEAVQSRKRVASMQLTNATVASLEDGVLTIAFRQPGIVKGFLAAENDKVLADVLADVFGIRVRISASVGSGDVQGGGAAGPRAEGSGAVQAAPSGKRPGASARGAGGAQRPAGPAASQEAGKQMAGRGPYRPTEAARSAGSEPGHGDHQDADALTGTDLIARELGGRIIEELDGP
jgi:DNA polymerase-3 subunit gamma/tau